MDGWGNRNGELDVANVGASYELVFSHQCDMRVNSKNIDTGRYIYIAISLSTDRWIDRGLTGVAVHVTNVGANGEGVLRRHRYVMRG